jgi:hypothetical protein
MKRVFYHFSIFMGIIALTSCGGGNAINQVDLIPVKQTADGEYQYVDKAGKIVINAQFNEATIFRDGIALVQASSKEKSDQPQWGFIKSDGQFAFNTKFLRATVFSEGLAWVVAPNGAPTAINTSGETEFTLENAESVRIFKGGKAAFSEMDSSGLKWGFVDESGKVVINPQFAEVGFFKEGLCAVQNKEGKWGFIDESGAIIINYQFDGASEFNNAMAVVEQDDKCGVVDKQGKYKINPMYKECYIDGKIILVRQDDKFGWVNEENKFIANPQFSKLNPFNSSEIAPVKSGKTWGYSDQEGKLSINPQFDEACSFNNGIAMVRTGSNWGAVDPEGKYVINPQFADLADDYFLYVNYGRSEFEEVTTDFFNVSAIATLIDFNQPEGVAFGSTYGALAKKLNLDSNLINTYYFNGEPQIYNNKKINDDARISLSIVSLNLVKVRNVKDPSGFYDYPEKYVDYNAPVEGYVYEINLSNKGNGREVSLFEEISKSASGFKKEPSSQKYLQVLSKGNRKIIIGISAVNTIEILITENQDFVGSFLNYIKPKTERYTKYSGSQNGKSKYSEAATEVYSLDTASYSAPPARYRNESYYPAEEAIPESNDPEDVENW